MAVKDNPPRRTSRKTADDSQRRQLQAVDMQIRGLSFQEIADALGYADRAAAHNAYTAGLKLLPEVDDREAMLRVEAARLDALLGAQWPKAMKGDSEAARTVLAIMQRRAKLFGLDAPTKLEHKVTAELDQQIEDMLAEMARQPGAPAESHPG